MKSTFAFGVGPVWTHWGMRNHSLLLGGHEIVDCPYSKRDTVWLLFALHLPLLSDPEKRRRRRAVRDGLSDQELLSRGAIRYPVEWLQEIRLERRWMYNAIVIRTSSLAAVTYRFHHREHADACRHAFRQLYPDLYEETGFELPANWLKR